MAELQDVHEDEPKSVNHGSHFEEPNNARKYYGEGYVSAFHNSMDMVAQSAEKDIDTINWQNLPVVRLIIDISQLSEDEKKLRENLFELISQQAKYLVKLKDLDYLKNQASMKVGAGIEKEDFHTIFRFLDDIIQVETEFMDKLKSYFRSDLTLKHIGCFFDEHLTQNEGLLLQYTRTLYKRRDTCIKYETTLRFIEMHFKRGKSVWTYLHEISNEWVRRKEILKSALRRSVKYSPTYIFLRVAEPKFDKVNSLRNRLMFDDKKIEEAIQDVDIPEEVLDPLRGNCRRQLEHHCQTFGIVHLQNGNKKKTKIRLFVFNDLFFYACSKTFGKKRWVVKGCCSRTELIIRHKKGPLGWKDDIIEIIGGNNIKLTINFKKLEDWNYFMLFQPSPRKTDICSGPAIVSRNAPGNYYKGYLSLVMGDMLNIWSGEEDVCYGESFEPERKGIGRVPKAYIKLIIYEDDIIEHLEQTRKLRWTQKLTRPISDVTLEDSYV